MKHKFHTDVIDSTAGNFARFSFNFNTHVYWPAGTCSRGRSADSILGQGLAFGFGRPDQGDDADEVDGAHHDRGGAEGHLSGEVAEEHRRGRGEVTDGVVAETNAGAPE